MNRCAKDFISRRTADQVESLSDATASTDGTWMRRGHSLLLGVQAVITFDTQKIVDVEVPSKLGAGCADRKPRLASGNMSQADFDVWKASNTNRCYIDKTVSSLAMQASAVCTLWSRSEELRGLRYTGSIGDGDSKGHSAVLQDKPYRDVLVVKEECVGHVQKRLGKGFRDLKQSKAKEKLADGKPIGGKGQLTDKTIDSLQNYYGMAACQYAGERRQTKC
eukprot:scpid71914/ scgid26349/ 